MHAETSRRTTLGGASPGAFFAILASLFAACTGLTVAWCTSMAAMDGMPMPGRWTLSMAWMPMDGQAWPGVAASFLGMWVVMMMAMMLPSFGPVLWRFHQATHRAGGERPYVATVVVGAGYFTVWALLGTVVFPVGAVTAWTAMAMPAAARAVPMGVGVVVLAAGALQFTRWKAHGLACCRQLPDGAPSTLGVAWRNGVRHGWHCVQCCAGLTAMLLAWGVMDLRAMILVTTAISAERLAATAVPIVRAVGMTAMVAGLLLIARASGLA